MDPLLPKPPLFDLQKLKDSIKKCDKLRENVAKLEEEKRVLCDRNMKVEERYKKIIELLFERIEELKNEKSDVEDKLSELKGRLSLLEEERLDLDGPIDVQFPHGPKFVCDSTGNSTVKSRNTGTDNINLAPTENSSLGSQSFQCASSSCHCAQVVRDSNKQKESDHSAEAGPLPINLDWENGKTTRNSLACEAGDCVENNLNAVSDKPGSSPAILIIDGDDEMAPNEMAYGSKSSHLGGNLTCPQVKEVHAKDSSKLLPKRKRSMSESENNDVSSFGSRQNKIPIQELVKDGKRSFVGENSANPERSSNITRVIPSPEQNSVSIRPCEDKVDPDPKPGLEFDSDESAIKFYNEYARRVGFSVRKEYVNTNKKLGYVTSRKITCFKEGFRGDDKRRKQVKNPREETRTGCNAHIIVTRQSIGTYLVTKVELEHNHPLVPHTMVHMLPSHRKIKKVQAQGSI